MRLAAGDSPSLPQQEPAGGAGTGRSSDISSPPSLVKTRKPDVRPKCGATDIFHVNASDMMREVEQARREARARRTAPMLAAKGLTPTVPS